MSEMAKMTEIADAVESKRMKDEVRDETAEAAKAKVNGKPAKESADITPESSSDASTPNPAGNKKPGALRITSVWILNPRSLRLEFSNGAIRLFDRYRLRGPKYIPLMEEEHFLTVTTLDGDLHWESLNITCPASYVYDRSVPYDDNATAKEYVRTRRDIIQERIAVVLFPAMAIAGILGTVWWWINN